MELDEFKELYNNSTYQAKPMDNDIMEMIQMTSQGPLAQLQKKLKYTLYLLTACIVIFWGIFAAVLGVNEVVQNVPLLLVFFILLGECIVSLLNYYTVKKMQQNTGNVKQNLQKKLELIKRRFKWYYIIYITLFLMMPLYVELGAHYPSIGAFQGVKKINIFFRVAWYILIFGCIFKIKHEAQKQQYQQYFDRLKELISQIQ